MLFNNVNRSDLSNYVAILERQLRKPVSKLSIIEEVLRLNSFDECFKENHIGELARDVDLRKAVTRGLRLRNYEYVIESSLWFDTDTSMDGEKVYCGVEFTFKKRRIPLWLSVPLILSSMVSAYMLVMT